MSDQQERSVSAVQHEYTEAVYNIRHYSNLRFAVFSITLRVRLSDPTGHAADPSDRA